jgi:murein DD-endopeptidase MepM/ murein hydrolase activator NlpD
MSALNRRQALGMLAGAAASIKSVRVGRSQTPPDWVFSYPMGNPGSAPGDGLVILHGYACENVPFYTGWWHTGENWHLNSGETGGSPVYAVADGTVVYSGSNYPGLVVLVQHGDQLYSMYGHLDFDAIVAEGDQLQRGQLLGYVLTRTDGRLSHLHFELRTFYESAEINGDSPSYGVNCGYNCPPGPGYWPMQDSRHPSEMGWRNPTSVIANRAFTGAVPSSAEIIVSSAAGESASVWSAPKDRAGALRLDDLPTRPGDRHQLLEIDGGDEASTATSADGYHIWYRVALPNGSPAWVQAAIPSKRYTGTDGRPSTIRLRFLPGVVAG